VAKNANSTQHPKRAGKRSGWDRHQHLHAPVVLLVASGEVWLTLEDVRELTGQSAGHVRRKARLEAWVTRSSEFRGRNGKREQEYALSSLPSELVWDWFSSHRKCGN
jgi:hypothetical protein